MTGQPSLIYRLNLQEAIRLIVIPPNNQSGQLVHITPDGPDGDGIYERLTDGSFVLVGLAGGFGIISVTYQQLLDLKNSNQLIIGRFYLITDFRTRYIISNTAIVETGPIEPLIVQASGTNTIYKEAVSTSFPNDDIFYEIIDTTTSGGDRGRIYQRTDTTFGLTTAYNWRVIKFRRWETAPASGIFTVITNNGGAFNDYYTFNNSNSGSGCKDTVIWPITDFGITDLGAPSNKLNNIILLSDIHIIDNIFYQDCFNSTLKYTDVIGGNRMKPAFFQNTLIGTSFCIDNNLGPAFQLNQIGGSFLSNNINVACQNNIIGDAFAFNNIQGGFQNNRIANGFLSNQIGDNFRDNINIQDNFRLNEISPGLIGFDFAASTICYGDYTKQIFKNSAGVYRITYIDGTDTAIYAAPNA